MVVVSRKELVVDDIPLGHPFKSDVHSKFFELAYLFCY